MSRPSITILVAAATLLATRPAAADCVVLLHGLARTASSMSALEDAFRERGFKVANVDYPSRDERVEDISAKAVQEGLDTCGAGSDEKIHFVSHSMGGILVRYYLAHHAMANLGRVVMLAPPNNGSEVVDHIGDVPGFGLVNGPAGKQLGTGPNGIPAQLGPVTYPVGVIAGTHTINPILSQYLPNPDDGKVSVASTKVEGMTDFLTLPVSHPFIMRDKEAIRQTIAFIETGAFIHDAP